MATCGRSRSCHDADVRYDLLEDLEDWLERQPPVLNRRSCPPPCKKGALAFPAKLPRTRSWPPPLQWAETRVSWIVDEALAAMAEGNIHDTQVRALGRRCWCLQK